MPGRFVEVGGLVLEVLHGDVSEPLEHSPKEFLQILVVAVVVLGHRIVDPGLVTVGDRLPRLGVSQRRIGFDHCRQSVGDEHPLHHGLLTPQGAIVVDGRDPFDRGHEAVFAVGCHLVDEVQNRLFGGGVFPHG